MLQWSVRHRVGAFYVSKQLIYVSAGCVGGEAIDIVFLLDVLNSDVISGFGRLLVFISDVIDRFPSIGRLATRVALVTYAEHPRVEIFLDDFDSKTDLQVTLIS